MCVLMLNLGIKQTGKLYKTHRILLQKGTNKKLGQGNPIPVTFDIYLFPINLTSLLYVKNVVFHPSGQK